MGVSGAYAADYVSLINIPGLTGKESSIPDFVNTVYKITIGLGALLGVIKIAFAGVKYSMSDVVTDKAGAKKDILGVLLGLAILLLPWIVLNTIYPGLLNLNFAEKLNEAGSGLNGFITPLDFSEGSRGLEKIACETDDEAACEASCRAHFTAREDVVRIRGLQIGPAEGGGLECRVILTVDDSESAGTDFYKPSACLAAEGRWWDSVCDKCLSDLGAPGDECQKEPTSFVNCLHLHESMRSDSACESWCDGEGGEFDPATFAGGASLCRF